MLGLIYNRHYYRDVGMDLEKHYLILGVVYIRHYYREGGRDLDRHYRIP
jgi:hypothetical protein